MADFINKWLNEPLIVKLLVGVAGIIVILGLVRILQKALTNSIENIDLRYRMRKTIGFIGYGFILLFLAGEFSNQLHSVTVALGVAGAGIAFALQEVIVSIAGWLVISFRRFYKIGDRIQLSGTVGDVIDIDLFSTTLMEVGEWVKDPLFEGIIDKITKADGKVAIASSTLQLVDLPVVKLDNLNRSI